VKSAEIPAKPVDKRSDSKSGSEVRPSSDSIGIEIGDIAGIKLADISYLGS